MFRDEKKPRKKGGRDVKSLRFDKKERNSMERKGNVWGM